MTDATAAIRPPLAFFPMEKSPREKQVRSLEFIGKAVDKGYTDIVVAAPTGIGKTGIGAALCFWAGQLSAPGDARQGGYYLVTQKLLQDQLRADIRLYKPALRDAMSLMSATEYECKQYKTCMTGKRMQKDRTCAAIIQRVCPYLYARKQFEKAVLSITNYAYFFAERTFVGSLPKRKIIVLDECHGLEKQILSFVELLVSHLTLREWAPHIELPRIPNLNQFFLWLRDTYMPPLRARMQMYEENIQAMPEDERLRNELHRLETYVNRCEIAVRSIDENPRNWVYWQEGNEAEGFVSIAKPISAVQFMPYLIKDSGAIRVYMSAYPGPKDVFCRSLGLDVNKVAFASYGSTFPVENRPIHLTMVGSMGRKSIEDTTPSLLRQICRTADAHPEERGIIHCHSYQLGKTIFEYMRKHGYLSRVLFAAKAEDRNKTYETHARTLNPTILLSPSMTEGFNMIDDLARWQIIAKIPYPYLGDRQVQAKKELDPDWYTMQTCMTIIQACGRIVRSETDYGVTYILDSDFKWLYERYTEFFPAWFVRSFQWH